MPEISTDSLIEKRKTQMDVLNSINDEITQVRNRLNTLTENFSINRGALLQLNQLLVDCGVDVETLDAPVNGVVSDPSDISPETVEAA